MTESLNRKRPDISHCLEDKCPTIKLHVPCAVPKT